MFKKISKFFLDLLFPLSCVNCSKRGVLICGNCLRKICTKKSQSCPKCRRQTKDGKFCNEACNKQCYFDQIIVCCEYEKNSCLQRVITKFKYNHSLTLIPIFEHIISNSPFRRFITNHYIIVPVPLSYNKQRKRGFNQSKILARLIQNVTHTEFLVDCLSKKNISKAQAHSNRSERFENIKDSISIKRNYQNALYNKKILLVDDVSTTGATLNECSKVLKKAGASYVCAFVIARGERLSTYRS